ncbi:MAG: DUF58 domain-containing protein [Candidatus Hydrogenedentes bacterium]|nr:DUF58 domain-containing protein [Candidatus Hydrogenedentota bacterium]
MLTEAAARNTLLDPEFLLKLERLAIAAKRVQLGVTKGERKSKRKGSSVEFADYRDYVQGDDLRHVDWNIVGRLNALYLKLFQEQEDLTVHLLIDSSRSMSFGNPPKISFACKLAAAIGYIGLIGYDRVSAESFNSAGTQSLRPCRGRISAGKLFAFLSAIKAQGDTHLEEACRSYLLRNRSKGVIILISDFFDQDGFVECLRRLAQANCDLYVVHVLSPEEIDPPMSGDLKLIDCEIKAFTEVSVSRTLLKRYKSNLGGFCEEIRRACLARGIGYVFTSSAAPVERLTLEVLRKGGLVR